ncbi:hypothetical protein PF005_g4700 [Phytophthora fragariae]|uniref:TRUD domain-containing protein n=1 Tax=Phytophthora fragariae TaxID=53985 RepID=A0A6A3UNP5_9STRA|nr:hypothetical protein PF003_g4798 [Phytophthora fragariae]KAE8945303.1 hypothetical protein PF009_g5026 [Phytophthora fragariae]KAE9024179.1 hypothetical protein PF011_g3612 [Phytophthora fragariae]KAE9129826.1 hypothetical protein PF007_g4737 [Phytophthora fragariae]KAE9151858.1 hypothetical protein PF006_g3876 [Phytophthora fragariae]
MESKVAVLDGSAVGIEAFVDASKGRLIVRGRIKSKPEDFVVREISAAGEVVGFSDKSDRVPTESERDDVLKKIEEASQKQKKERLVFDEPADGWRAALTELIGAEACENVASVAYGRLVECFLSSPTEFRDRVYLQNCIQNCFPGLDCKLQKALSIEDQAEEQQIQVVLDHVYKKFRDGGVAIENCDCLLAFLRKGADDPPGAKGLELEHEDTKEARTTLHRVIAKNSSSFKTKTETRNGVQRLIVHFLPKNGKKRKRSQPQAYLRFVLQKTNQEHFACFDKLARWLHRPLSAFSYAGTKDKTAITFQHVVASGVAPDRLLGVNNATCKEDASTGIRVGDLQYVETPMALGGASGNRFSIVIRGLSDEMEPSSKTIQSTLESALENIKHQGFANYFGFQRVGLPTNTVRAHHIGEKIIASKWEEALRLILAAQDSDSEDGAKAKQLYLESRDVEAALKLMPHGMSVERQVFQGLKRFGSDAFEQAVLSVSFSRRAMYMHAYQSYLFNRIVSLRLHKYGNKVVEGDLIKCDIPSEKSVAMKVVTAEEAAELNRTHKHALGLVYLPLPGTSVTLPSNSIKEACLKMMEEDGTKGALCEVGPVKGAYRSLVAYPRDLEWTWQEDDDKALSLQLSFSLDSGCFATMCLREVLHSDL